MRKLTAIALGGALFLASSGTIAGGCLQGTWTYYDDDGGFVGYETVGCGDADGLVGERSQNKSFTQGCASPI